MANLSLEDSPGRNATSDTEVDDDTVWKDLPLELLEKCLGHLPVLMIASTLRAVNRTWSSYHGTPTFMALHNHRDNIDSCFGFLMFGTNILTHQCETMALDHNTLKWQLAPSLQLDGPYRTCQVESVSEGILCLRPHPATSPPFTVWNPLLPSSCKQTIPRMSQENYWNVNLVVDRENASFKILAFTSWFRECHVFSSTTSSWLSHKEGPRIYEGLFFPQHRDGGHITVTHHNCLYVAVGSLVDDVHQVGDLCYDVNRNVWKPSSSSEMFSLPPEIVKLYGYCFTRALFVVSDVMYKVVEYVGGVHLVGDARPSPTVQILARSVAPENNAENSKWGVIATTILPQADWESNRFGTWYGCVLDGHEKPTICGLFKSEPYLHLMMYSIGSCKWETVRVTDEASTGAAALDGSQDAIGIMIRIRRSWRCQWTANPRKWLSMNMVPNYEPSWICPSGECKKHGSQEPGCLSHQLSV